MSWDKHDLTYDHPDGRQTRLWAHTQGNQVILSEHPDNNGPDLSTVATAWGDQQIQKNLKADHKSRPEDMQLYAERPDGRFDRWEAKTTREQNVAIEPNKYDSMATEWAWKGSTQHDHGALQQQFGVKVEAGGSARGQQLHAESQDRDLKETALPKIEQSEELRKAAQERQQPRSRDR